MLLSYHLPYQIEAGCDEAGRGCLAGPVFAAAVILPPDFYHVWLNDSKQTTEKQRVTLRKIIEAEAISWAVSPVLPEEIDRINILQASITAMHQALDGLNVEPDMVLIDGNRFRPWRKVAYQCFVEGDAKYAAIAAASILAKTHRDEYMTNAHDRYPHYGWAKNKGYPTRDHREAIRQYGVSPEHRRSFRLLPLGEQLTLPLV